LPRYISYFEGKASTAESAIEGLKAENERLTNEVSNLEKIGSTIDSVNERLANLQHIVNQHRDTVSEKQVINKTMSDNHNYDMFYKHFEDEFRGSEDLIKERITEHLPLFFALAEPLKKLPIVDIGCGRGEFLSIMSENGFNAIGVDMNDSMVEQTKKLGLNSIRSDALSYLFKQKNSSLAAVTGFHIVEHIPFEQLMDIFTECYRTIKKGGVVLFETPNPHNLNVGACNFYMDPSHIRPLPPELLAFSLKMVGFDTEVVKLHPKKESITHTDETMKDIIDMLYGPQDYAVIGRKI